LPGVPGTPLVLLAAIGHRLYFGAASVTNTVLVLIVLLMVCRWHGLPGEHGRREKARRDVARGGLGAVLGGLIGIFFNIPGINLRAVPRRTVVLKWSVAANGKRPRGAGMAP